MHKLMLAITMLLTAGFAVQVVTFDDNWGQDPQFNIISETQSGMEIVFSLHEMLIEDVVIDNVPMQSYGLASIYIPQEGAPSLGGATRYLAIPQGAEVNVTIMNSRTEVYPNIEIAPAPNIPRENDDSPLRYEKDMAVYGRNAYYPQSPVIVSAPMQIRGVDVVIMNVTPFQYNPVTKELVVYRDLRVKVDYVGGNGHFGEDRLRSRFWEPVLQGHLLNYRSLPVVDFYAPQRMNQRDGWEYIIIVPDDPVFEAWADTIKTWRKLQGISCEVFTLTEVGGNTTTAIENFLNNAYNTWDPAPAAFLLLSDYQSSGDLYGITSPVWTGSGGPCISDNIYADVDNDDLPDMHHARICAQNATHLSAMINKFLGYERNPYTAANFYDEPLMACGWQDERWFQLCIEVIRGFFINELGKNPARQYAIFSGTPTVGCAWSTNTNTAAVVAYFGPAGLGYIPEVNQHSSSWWSNGSASGINAAINSGAFLVQHRDHGYENGWGEPSYSSSDLNGLTNTLHTFVYSSNCLTGKFNWSNECFTEKFHRMNYGALGVNAASEVSYSFVNDAYVWGMYDCLWTEFMPDYPIYDTTHMMGFKNLRPCMAMTSGKYFLEQSSWPYNPGSKDITYHLFHHHGDAFMQIYSEIPESLLVNHPPYLAAGMTSFTVTTNNGSFIALTVNGEIIGIAEGQGMPVTITIPPQTAGSTLIITITKPDCYRYSMSVPVTSTAYPYVTLGHHIIDDMTGGNGDGYVNPGETIDYGAWVKNVGTSTAQGIYGLLSTVNTYVSISTDSSYYGNINSGDSAYTNPEYMFSVANNCPNGQVVTFDFNFHDFNDSVFTSYTTFTVYAPVLVYEQSAVMDANGFLEPGETSDMMITLSNIGDAIADNVSGVLSTNSSYITVVDSIGSFGSITPGDTANNNADPYTLTAAVPTPLGTVADFELVLTSGVYADTVTFSLTIGKKHYYVWNPDITSTPGQNIHSILGNLGYIGDHDTTLTSDLTSYQSLFICLGVNPNNYFISSATSEATGIHNFVENGGRAYLEGGDVWFNDPLYGGHNFGPLFGITPAGNGMNNLGPLAGEPSTFAQGMYFQYGGENNSMDYVMPSGNSTVIFRDDDNNYNCAIAYDEGTYKTVGTNFELGMLDDSLPPSTRTALLDSIMHFFGITTGTGIEEYTKVSGVPLHTALAALYPNPFTGQLRIDYALAADDIEHAWLIVYDITGRLVRNLSSQLSVIGHLSSVIWDGRDDIGRKVPAGVYFVKLETADYNKVEKAVILK